MCENDMMNTIRIRNPYWCNTCFSFIVKAFKNALCEDDSHVHTYGTMKKIWGDVGQIEVNDKFVLENNEN